MKEEFYRWLSPNLNQSIEMLVFGHQGLPLILFPPNDGSFDTCRDAQAVAVLSEPVKAGKLKVYCPEVFFQQHLGNYDIEVDQRIERYLQFERALVKEIFHKARIDTHRSTVALAGIAGGAFHAANFGMRHPDLVSHIWLIDGIYTLRETLNGQFSEEAYFNSPEEYMGGMKEGEYLDAIRKQHIAIGMANSSERHWQNRNFSKILNLQGIWHTVEQVSGGGNWGNWNSLLSAVSKTLI